MTTAVQARPDERTGASLVIRAWRVVYRSGLLIPLAFLLLMAAYAPVSDGREFDTDEGVNLIKALLVGRGHALYSEIWDDQPPLLTAALAGWFHQFGNSVLAA